jgi:diacylglycerol kinase-like protein
MYPVKRALLIINRASGVGLGDVAADRLSLMFEEALRELTAVEVALVSDHPAARSSAAKFISASDETSLIIVGGGGGTLRAVIEGICGGEPSKPLPGPQRVRVGALRMGSGNILAKQFGVPRDPVAGMRGLLRNLETGLMVSCCVIRCEVWNGRGDSETYYVTALAGFGQFGRIPRDLARWHFRMPRLHKGGARLLGIERLNNLEYASALLLRSVSCLLFPGMAEAVEFSCQGQEKRMRLLSGVMMNLPIKQFPFKPTVRIEDEAVSVYLIPFKGRLSPLRLLFPRNIINHSHCIRLEKNQRLELRVMDRDSMEFFLDEDPHIAYRRLSLEVAGSISFVPGPDYEFLAEEGVSA